MRRTSGSPEGTSCACATPRTKTRIRESIRRNSMTALHARKMETAAIVVESSILGKQGIEKTVPFISLQRQNLPGRRQPSGVGMPTGEGHRLPLALFWKYRACGIEQMPPGAQRLPQGIHDAPLQRGSTRHIIIAAQPADVRMAPDHARGGTWHIGQNGVVGLAIPPCLQIGGIGRL